MTRIPPAIDTDNEDVVWALQTAEALWQRNDRADAVVWLRRAAQAASDAEDDSRALALARDAAALVDELPSAPPPRAPSGATPATSTTPASATPHVPTAAEVHAGMLDPWAQDGEAAQKDQDLQD